MTLGFVGAGVMAEVMITGLLDEGIVGMIEESTTRSDCTPRTRNCASTTAPASPSGPMRQVPIGCQEVWPQPRM